jgi:hypothetical protein
VLLIRTLRLFGARQLTAPMSASFKRKHLKLSSEENVPIIIETKKPKLHLELNSLTPDDQRMFYILSFILILQQKEAMKMIGSILFRFSF